MSSKEKLKRVEEILYDVNMCNAEKFEEIERIVLQHKPTDEH
jgi:hypothetical protein